MGQNENCVIHCKGEERMKECLKLNSNPGNGLVLTCEWKGALCDLVLTNPTEERKTVGDLVLFTAKMPFAADTRVYGEGYNMLSQYAGTIKDCRLIGPYSDYAHYKLWKPEGIHQVRNMAIFYPENEDPERFFSRAVRCGACGAIIRRGFRRGLSYMYGRMAAEAAGYVGGDVSIWTASPLDGVCMCALRG